MSSPNALETATRILLADDHAIVRQALCALLESVDDFEVVSQVGDAQTAVRATFGHRPDVAILDLNMPDSQQTIDAIPQILSRSPHTRVVVLTMDEDKDSAVAAMRAGAVAYVLKDAADDELVQVVRSACLGHIHLTPRIGAALAAATVEPPNAHEALSARERDIIRLTALGLTSREIGSELFLSVRTVETHRANINAKLDFTNRADLVRFALDTGLMERGSTNTA